MDRKNHELFPLNLSNLVCGVCGGGKKLIYFVVMILDRPCTFPFIQIQYKNQAYSFIKFVWVGRVGVIGQNNVKSSTFVVVQFSRFSSVVILIINMIILAISKCPSLFYSFNRKVFRKIIKFNIQNFFVCWIQLICMEMNQKTWKDIGNLS